MKKFKPSYKHILLTLLMLTCVFVSILVAWPMIPMIYNPIRRPAHMIRNHILRHTPIGINIEEAIRIIDANEQWGIPVINKNSGFRHPRRDVSGWPVCSLTGAAIIGNQSIETRVEIYFIWGLFERRVRIFWGFDDGGRLIEIAVGSTYV